MNEINIPSAPTHRIIIISNKDIVKYIAKSIGIREGLVLDKEYRKHLYQRIDKTIIYRHYMNDYIGEKNLKDMKNLFILRNISSKI